MEADGVGPETGTVELGMGTREPAARGWKTLDGTGPVGVCWPRKARRIEASTFVRRARFPEDKLL